MKKLKVIVPVLLVVMMLFTLCSCEKKEAITADTFVTKAESLGYATQHDDDFVAENSDVVKDVVIAYDESSLTTDDDGNVSAFKIEFYQLTSESSASGMFESNKETFDAASSAKTYVSTTHSASFKGSDGSTYYRLARVNDTLIYAKVDIDSKDAVEDFIEAIGY